MESRTINMLEFPKVLQRLSQEAVSSPGKQACLDTSFFHHCAQLEYELGLLREIISFHQDRRPSLNAFPDINPCINKFSHPDSLLDIEECWDISAVLREAQGFFASFKGADAEEFKLLKAMTDELSWPQGLISGLGRCFGPAGEIKDDSSPELYAVRNEIRSIRNQCSRKINESLTLSDISHYLQDDYLTISSDRYVMALKANFRGRLKGIIHDYSQTGETCYFEPFFLTELNNKLQKLKRQEREELRAVLRYLTDLCRAALEDLKTLFRWLVRMDCLLAKAKLGEKIGAVPMNISETGRLKLKNVRHPLLVLGGFAVTPIDIELEPGQRVLVVSGGNAGGKTVCLKTLGLTALMALSALPVPADQGSTIPLWDKIFVSMVSEQSVEDSLSTFTAQIHHFSRFWPMLDGKSLVILDEFGVGTDPSQGAALAQAVIDGLLEKKAWVGTATHFPALKAYALSRDQVRAASVLFDADTGKPLYRLAYDQVGSSLALGMAREQGLPAEIISRAEKYLLLDGQEKDAIFGKLNRLALQKEQELERIRKTETVLKDKFERQKIDLQRQKDILLEEIRSAARQVLSDWQSQKMGRKKALKELAELKGRLYPAQDESSSPEREILSWEKIVPGERYVYRPWNKQGVIQEKDDRKGQVKIDLGGISLWVDPQVLEHSPDDSVQAHGRHSLAGAAQSMPLSLDLRGMHAREALLELDRYLDQSLLAGRKKLEVIHGKGTGVLRTAVHEHLKDNPAVAAFRFASQDCGGEGMTEVELK